MDNNEEYVIDSIGARGLPSFSFEEECERAYCGSDEFYYRSKTAYISFWAMFWGPYYYFYRKMIGIGIILCFFLFFIQVPMELLVILWLVEGALFYPLYRYDSKRQINKILIEQEGQSDEVKLEKIRNKGGVSMRYALASLLAFYLFNLIYTLILG